MTSFTDDYIAARFNAVAEGIAPMAATGGETP
jgi:hypothetical protein